MLMLPSLIRRSGPVVQIAFYSRQLPRFRMHACHLCKLRLRKRWSTADVHESFCPRPEAIWASDGLNTEVSVTARLNTILVFIYRGLAIFQLNAVITVDD